MFGSTETLTYNTNAKVLNRVTDGNYSAKYYLDDAGVRMFNLRVEHTIPSSPAGSGESHMIRLDLDHYDAENVYERTESAWFVLKTTGSKQDSSQLDLMAQCLVDFLTDANLDKLIAREA